MKVLVVCLWLCYSAAVCEAQSVMGAGLAGAVGLDLPVAHHLGLARHFPQGLSGRQQSSLVGLRLLAYPELAGFNMRQIGLVHGWKVYQAAAYADFYGDHLFGWQHYRISAGLPLGKVRFGTGLGLYRWWVADLAARQWQGNFGISGTFKGAWHWHLAYQTAVVQPTSENIIQGAPTPLAFLAVSHQVGPVQLWGTYVHRNGQQADYGLAVIWKAHHHLQLDVGAAPRARAFSIGAMWFYSGFRWHLQCRWQQLPGVWFDNTLLWRKEHAP